jgi:sulfur carrier protein ThiS
MIRIYPSALDGEPLETHSIKREMTLADFMRSKVPNFDDHQGVHPVSISVNDYIVKSEKWDQFHILPEDDVKITPEPKGAIAIAVLVVVRIL